MTETQLTLAAVNKMTLESFPDLELAALNNAIQLQESCPEANMAFERALDQKLIKDSGRPYDLEPLRSALAMEVNDREDAGWPERTD